MIKWLPLALLLPSVASAGQCFKEYQFELKDASSFGNTPATVMNMQGRVAIKPMPEMGQGWWAVKGEDIWLSQLTVKAADPDYLIPFAIKLNAKGAIEKYWFADSITEQQQQKLTGLSYYFQFSKKSGDISFDDSLGRYHAKVINKEQGLQLNKLNYQLDNSFNEGPLQEIDVVQSQHYYQIEECLFSLRRGIESLKITGLDTSMDV